MATTSSTTPDFTAAADHAPEADPLAKAYRLVAELFVNPERTDPARLVGDAREQVLPAVADNIGEETAASLAAFLRKYETMRAEQFVETHELSPACPLYLGHYAFDEPQTCRDIADAERNQYMVELNAIYEHYGFELDDELPDFLPAMIEFCWLTLPERGDGLRTEFQYKLLALLPAMRERFEEDGTPYLLLLDVIERLLRVDLAGDSTANLDVPDGDELELLPTDGGGDPSGGGH